MTQAIALVDGNNFYVSCERIFRPDLQHVPVIVMSNNDGCAIARSQEVKALGISMGTPIFKLKNLIKQHNIQLFSANFGLYGNISSRVVQTLKTFSPDIEVYSIDESFIDLSHYQHLNLTDYGHKIKHRIKQWVGVPTCVGIAPTKTLAKLANEIAKKNPIFGGVCNLMERHSIDQVLPHFDVDDIWGVGRATARKLHARDIHTAQQLCDLPDKHAREIGNVVLERLVQELRGIACLDLEILPASKKGVVVTRSFGQPVTSFSQLLQSLTHHASRAGEKLRNGDLLASQMTVFVHTSKHRGGPQYHGTHTINIQPFTANNRDLISVVKTCLEIIYKPGYQYVKSGVMLNDLCAVDLAPRDLFEFDQTTDNKALMSTIDKLNQKYGRGTIFSGAMGVPSQRTWAMKQEALSQNFLTDINDVLVVNI